MIPSLKAEFRKLVTVRSTYVWTLLAYALLAFVSFYGAGYRSGLAATTGPGANLFLSGSIEQFSDLLSVFGAIVALLLMAHEYRYNTVMYSLTNVNARSKILLAKIATMLAYVFVFVIVGDTLGLSGMVFGLRAAGHMLPHQDISLLAYYGKSLFYCECWAMAGLAITGLIRNQVASMATLLLFPTTIEGLLSLLLKHYTVYLPFSALTQVISPPVIKGTASAVSATGELSPLKGAMVFGLYLIAIWAATWVLFIKRDAN